MISLFGSFPCLAGDVYYYRYKDADGYQVITSTLPADVADKGYEVISPRGNVIKTIKPAKTPEEIAADKQALEEKRQAELKAEENKKNEERQAKKDDILLKSFTTEEDIIRSRDEKIASIVVLEQIMNENITRLNKQLNDANNAKDNYVKTGQVVPEPLKKTIADSERQIKENEAFLQRKKVEKDNIQVKYEGLIARFKELNKQEEKSPSVSPQEIKTNVDTTKSVESKPQ